MERTGRLLGQTRVPVGLPPAIAIAGSYGGTFSILSELAPSLTLLRNADETLSLSWNGADVLGQTESLTPPDWQPTPYQDNPHTFSTTNPMKFFRIKAN